MDTFAAPMTAGTLVMISAAILGYLLKRKMDRWDDHLEKCESRSINHALLEQQVSRIDEKVGLLTESIEERRAKVDQMDNKIDRLFEVMATKRTSRKAKAGA